VKQKAHKFVPHKVNILKGIYMSLYGIQWMLMYTNTFWIYFSFVFSPLAGTLCPPPPPHSPYLIFYIYVLRENNLSRRSFFLECPSFFVTKGLYSQWSLFLVFTFFFSLILKNLLSFSPCICSLLVFSHCRATWFSRFAIF
jgi:hypothetical protein